MTVNRAQLFSPHALMVKAARGIPQVRWVQFEEGKDQTERKIIVIAHRIHRTVITPSKRENEFRFVASKVRKCCNNLAFHHLKLPF